MANPVLGKSLCSDWFFLGQDFAVRTVSMETVQSVYFCFGAKPANSTFATKTAKKKCETCHSSHWNYQQKLKRLTFFRNSKDGWRRRTFFKCKPGTECHIINYLLTELARAVPGNIGPRSFSYRRTVTTSGQYSPVRPSRSVSKRLLFRCLYYLCVIFHAIIIHRYVIFAFFADTTWRITAMATSSVSNHEIL